MSSDGYRPRRLPIRADQRLSALIRGGAPDRESVFVVVAAVCGVTAPVVYIVDVFAVWYRHVPASVTVNVRVLVVDGMLTRGDTFVEMILVRTVDVTVVDVVDMIAVGEGDVSTTLSVYVIVALVWGMYSAGHDTAFHRMSPTCARISACACITQYTL
jgi:hypothetical protein